MDTVKSFLKNKSWIIRITVTCIILFISWFAQWGFTSIKATDAIEIQKLVFDSVKTEQTASILPEPYRSNLNTRIPDKVQRKANEVIEGTLSRFYIPNSQILKKMVGQSEALINAQETGNYRFLDGGISKCKNIKISGHGNIATVSADIWVWDKALINNVIAHPEIGLHYQFSVVRIGKTWAISDESSDIIPGEGA
ncbi:hypothetical protein Desaci_2078 [Desulfosporosinus acidiphilus SJ4]|uniref:Conjugative transposon protein TcpC n=1 Tax=Desulfosporosinus acidiphilus (strain DSM 22704 / JCM 16185 / SJ4) TaxID=646529 RepID=I4D5H6_DESAJ|nr:hypothetical protein [Desulfosporosinus acidiphilus]AFM41050.1 hypothetical protein Desaci_2078 [Desulfosporosinus acidiphilus SJ4]